MIISYIFKSHTRFCFPSSSYTRLWYNLFVFDSAIILHSTIIIPFKSIFFHYSMHIVYKHACFIYRALAKMEYVAFLKPLWQNNLSCVYLSSCNKIFYRKSTYFLLQNNHVTSNRLCAWDLIIVISVFCSPLISKARRLHRYYI